MALSFCFSKHLARSRDDTWSSFLTAKSRAVLVWGFSWCFILFPRLPERFNFAHRNSFFMSHVISLWLVRTCNLQVLTSRREMSFELKGNANLIRYSDLCISLLITKKIKLPEPGIEPGTFGVWSQDSTTELTFLWWK